MENLEKLQTIDSILSLSDIDKTIVFSRTKVNYFTPQEGPQAGRHSDDYSIPCKEGISLGALLEDKPSLTIVDLFKNNILGTSLIDKSNDNMKLLYDALTRGQRKISMKFIDREKGFDRGSSMLDEDEFMRGIKHTIGMQGTPRGAKIFAEPYNIIVYNESSNASNELEKVLT